MKIKRIVSGLSLFLVVAVILIFGNTISVNLLVSAVAILAINEYYNAVNEKGKIDKTVGNLCAILIAFIGVLPKEIIFLIFPLAIMLLFLKVILSKMETNFGDVVYSSFGIVYIVGFIIFLPFIYSLENGKFLIWYLLFAAFGTDTFAYLIGSLIGKHKLSPISPKKSVEGAIGGIIGALAISLIYTYFINKYANLEISYIAISAISVALSILAQVGDLAASAIKRYVGIKDFSNLIPGHGGMLDRIDSILFIAPFAYLALILL